MRTIKEDGYAIMSDVVRAQEVDQLLGDLSPANAPRSRAGSRHALRHAVVRTLAGSTQVTALAREVLGHEAFHFARPSLINHRRRIGWSFGIRIRPCRFASGMTILLGGRGR